MIRLRLMKLLFVIICLFSSVASARNISCVVNPGFDDFSNETSSRNILHIISEGENDDIHFVWSTYKLPSVIVASTSKNTTLLINSTKLMSFDKDAILFEDGKPFESIGVTFSKLWELHYDNDSSPITDALSAEDLELDSFDWTGMNDTSCSSSFATVVLKGRSRELLFSKNGELQIKFSVSGDQEPSDEFPHMVFTGNSSLLKFVFNNFYSNISHSRYGLEISMFSVLSDQCETENWKKVISQSINDEISPGVFTDVELRAPCSNEAHAGSSFVSWRPVAYTGEEATVANSSDVTMMGDPKSSSETEIQSVAELYFQNKSNVSVFNITFGTPGDGFYVATKYTSWTLMIGTGSLIEVPLSTLVIVLASIGIGLLLLFLVTGSIFVLYHRCKEKDDDLLLN